MALGPIRPRFKVVMPFGVEESIRRLEAAAGALGPSRCTWRVLGRHVDITIAGPERRRWSPCLHIEFDPAPGDAEGAIAHGLVGPQPDAWTLYALSGIAISTAAGFAFILGVVQLALDSSPWGLWVGAACLAALGGLYALSQIGQRCAAGQMRLLLDLVEQALGPPVDWREDRAGAAAET